MNSENMERLIKNLGCSYDALIANKVIDKLPLQDLYEDGESLEVEPVPGIELIFWPETLRFEVIHITLTGDQVHDLPVFSGILPAPFTSISNHTQVRETFGNPIFSKTAMELKGTGLSGWDTYQLDTSWHPAVLVDFQYSKNQQISKLLFSLIDRNV